MSKIVDDISCNLCYSDIMREPGENETARIFLCLNEPCGKRNASCGAFLMEDMMPTKPKVPCKHPGCPNLVPVGKKYCDDHKPLHPEEIRSGSSRGYGRQWQKARKQYLEVHPLCVECMKQGQYVRATDVDHIIPHRGDPDLFWDQSNWQPLCHSHHSQKTRREDQVPEYRF